MRSPLSPKCLRTTQSGATTLLMATALLIAVSMIAVYSARTTIVEQRVAANTIWSNQSSDAGQSAMDNIVSLSQSTLQSLAGGKSTLTMTNDPDNKSSGVVKSNSAIVVPTGTIYTADLTTTDSFKTVNIDLKVTGTGRSAEKRIYQRAIFGSFLKELPAEIPQAAITAKDDVDVPRDNLRYSKATEDAEKKPANEHMVPRKATIMCKSYKGVKETGAPTVGETETSVLTPPATSEYETIAPSEFEGGFFSDSGTHLKETAEHYIKCPSGGCTNTDVAGLTGFIWIDGDLTLDNKTLGNYGTKAITATDGGIDSVPVLLAVDGKLTMKNNAVVNGLVYKLGDWNNGTNTGRVNGAVVVNGTGNGSGSNSSNQKGLVKASGVIVNYEINILWNVQKLGRFAPLPGTWRDF